MWVWIRTNTIIAVFPNSTEASVRAAAEVLGHEVQWVEGALVGDIYDPDQGQWVRPPAPPVADPPVPGPRWLDAVHFRHRFSAMEEAAIRTLSATNPVVAVFYERLLHPRLVNVDLNDSQVSDGLAYLATLDDPLSTLTPKSKVLTAARITDLLA